MNRLHVLVFVTVLGLPAQDSTAFQQARDSFQRAMQESDPARKKALLEASLSAEKTFEAWYALGNVQSDLKEYQDARRSFQSAIALAKGDRPVAAATFKMGLVADRQGRTLEAIALLEQSLERVPDPTVEAELKRLRLASLDAVRSAQEIDSTLATSRALGRTTLKVDLRINFEFNKADLAPQGRKQADELGKWLSKEPYEGYVFVLIGHTDLKGSTGYNQSLSQKRAEAVKEYVTERYPIAVKRMRTEGHGMTEPLYRAVNEESDRLNRRVELRLIRKP